MNTTFHSDSQGSPDSISADLQAALRRASYPANKDAIVAAAVVGGAGNEVVAVLNGLPERDYPDADAVLHDLG